MGLHPIIIGGEKRLMPVFRLQTKLLAFNIRNGRFAAELSAKEKQLGHKLDPLVRDDDEVLRKLLLELDPAATEALTEDLKKVGQTDPGIITHDGFVINGNRRMAVLQLLHGQESTGKFEYLEVQRLPEDITQKDLWRIEAGLQLSRDKRLEYGPVNDLLKIREGLTADLTYDEIAATMYGVKDPDEVEQKDKRLALIDDFLEYIGDPGSYTRANGFVEHFINLQNFLRWLEEQGFRATDRHKWLLVSFELIRSGVGHMDIRRLRSIAQSADAAKHVLASIRPKPGTRSADDHKVITEQIKDDFYIAKEYVDLEEQAKKPEALLKRAIRALETLLKHKSDLSTNSTLQEGVKNISKIVNELSVAASRPTGTRKHK